MIAEANPSPRHQASLRTGFELGHNLRLNLWGRYVADVHLSGSNLAAQAQAQGQTVKKYFALDSNIIWQPRPDLELMLVGQNILDSQHLEFVQESFTSPIEIERSVYAKLTWKF